MYELSDIICYWYFHIAQWYNNGKSMSFSIEKKNEENKWIVVYAKNYDGYTCMWLFMSHLSLTLSPGPFNSIKSILSLNKPTILI